MEFVLDVSKWRCGGQSPDPENTCGEGATSMLNEHGYMCCVGQFCGQLDVNRDHMSGCASPRDLPERDQSLVIGDNLFLYREIEAECENSLLTDNLLLVNDDESLSVDRKLAHLRRILKSQGHTLKVINHEERREEN